MGTAAAQAPTVEWEKVLGGDGADYFYSVIQCSDGGYLAAGKYIDVVNGTFGWLVKLYPDGSIEWDKKYGSNTTQSLFNSVVQTSDGGYMAAGTTNTDALLVKLYQNGSEDWNITYGGSSFDTVVQASDGGYIAIDDDRLVKVYSNGSIEWDNTYSYHNSYSGGLNSIFQTSDGGYIAAGLVWACTPPFKLENYDGGC